MIKNLIAHLASQRALQQLKRFEKQLDNCQAVQDKVRHNILRCHQNSDFGREHRFEAIKSYADFRQALPIATYQYFEPWIEKCKTGPSTALLGPSEKLVMFALTSGTTAAAKYIPVTERFIASYRRGWNIWGIQAFLDYPHAKMRRILQVTSPAEESRTPNGIPCGAISGMLAAAQKSIVQQFYATPACVANITDTKARYYTIVRLALACDLGFISTANPSTLLSLAQTLERNAYHLIRDLHDGTLHDKLAVDTPIRNELKPRLQKQPDRARKLEEAFNKIGRLLPTHCWSPAFLANWTGGTLGMYIPRLVEYYGSVPIRDIGLLASEGRMTIPLDDNVPEGPLDIAANFYEFVPKEDFDLHDGDNNGMAGAVTLPDKLTVLQAHELEEEKEYYLLLTNEAGLYRYHIGDLVRVTGWLGDTPVIEFLSKGAHTSSITGEKLTENQVVRVVRQVADELAIKLDNFIVAPQWDDPPHYRLYFESNYALPRGLLEQFAELVDSRLTLANIEYDSKRESARLGALSIRQLPSQLLAKRDDTLRQKNHGRAEQFKHRFLINQPLDTEALAAMAGEQ